MKYSILSLTVLASIAFTSCKKDRTCECTYTTVSQTSNQPGFVFTPQPPQTNTTVFKDVKKNNINLSTCVSSETTNNYKSASYTGTTVVYYDVVQVNKQDCKIK